MLRRVCSFQELPIALAYSILSCGTVPGPMLVHAATRDVKTAAASLRGIAILYCSQLEHIELPWDMIDVEAVICEFAAVAVVNLGPHQIGQADVPAAEFRESQRQSALPLVSGVIDDDDIAAAVLASPGVGDKAVRSRDRWPGECPGGQPTTQSHSQRTRAL